MVIVHTAKAPDALGEYGISSPSPQSYNFRALSKRDCAEDANMHFDMKRFLQSMTACVLAICAVPQSVLAQAAEHVVTPAEMNKVAVDASKARQHNMNTVREFVSSEKARHALQSSGMRPEQVKNAVASLNDAELAQLAAKVQTTQADFAAGKMSDHDLIIVLIAIAALILIIVAVR
jgi:hypothetical protein